MVTANTTGNGRREQLPLWVVVREGWRGECEEPLGWWEREEEDHMEGKPRDRARLKDSCSFVKCLFKYNSLPGNLLSITGCG